MSNFREQYDVIVVGGGHAGSEAALAAARMGMKTLLITMNIFTIAQMSCNPAIGGLAKGHLVRELDALGGEMGKAIDDEGIQFRMLNKSKGPAVWSLRAQADRLGYSVRMRRAIEKQENLDLLQAMATEVLVEKNKCVGVRIFTGSEIRGKAVILTAGTFLNGLVHIGMTSFPAGRAGEFAATGITESLVKIGFRAGRLKTGTPPRIDGRTADFTKMVEQPGDPEPVPFSFQTEKITQQQVPCFLTATNEKTHEILRSGFVRSPLFAGKIIGVGPRYCPSIETKLDQFPDRISHQLYLEPEGRDTSEYYVNGFSTSLPEDTQILGLRTVPGLENVKVTRLGYAIEYDFFPPNQLKATLETKLVENLYFAGQINGTSGYEEAAVQGFVAAVNATRKLRHESPFILDRSQAYIGVLIDDLINREIDEPYRIFTSLSEYRLLLRQDNADLRLSHFGHGFGLIPENFYRRVTQKKQLIARYIEEFKKTMIAPEDINPILQQRQRSTISEKASLYHLLKRPELKLEDFGGILDHPLFKAEKDSLLKSVCEQVEIEIKYEGYLKRQQAQVEKFRKLENKKIPAGFNFEDVASLSRESREKLKKIQPRSIGQASRIAGVSPSDIAVLLVAMKKMAG
ncbi:MAG: tRNA uridine-5-carboxymethylaminomethyl(34) synthesis enzyme MnmG [Calditrichaeota bacterium]|nr:tRNA uridine-5-carboxymethylaminomethyl(34) synthesis enzyme MnmG [Calditrichota bacterium]